MLPILITAALAGSPLADNALVLCKPALARRVDGDISSISADRLSRHGATTVVAGSMRALTGMGDPAPGMASTHHLIRQDFRFSCTVRGGKVRKTRVDSQP